MNAVLCWDIDGTLLTTARAGVFALEEAAQEICGVKPDLTEMKTAGMTDGQIAALVLGRCNADSGVEGVRRFLRAYESALPERLSWRRGQVLPGVLPILDDLRERTEVHSLLLTGNTPGGAAAKLAHYGLDGYFDGGAYCNDLEPREEIAARCRALAAERLASKPDPESLFVIGDTPADVRCGKAIGARTVAVAGATHTADELTRHDPWLVLDGLPAPQEFAGALGLG